MQIYHQNKFLKVELLHKKICVFFKLYFIVCALTVVQIFTLCPNSPSSSPTSGNPLTIVHVHGSCMYVPWLLYSLCCALHPHDYSVTTNLYFLISSPFSPISPTTLPTDNHQNILCILRTILCGLIITGLYNPGNTMVLYPQCVTALYKIK